MMKNALAIAKHGTITVSLFLLTGCLDNSNYEMLKKNVHYWTYTGKEQCVNLEGVPYCFLKKDIDAASFPTDAGAGFLFMAPTDDPDLVDCAKPWYNIDWESKPYPNIHMTFSEPNFSSNDVHSDGRVHKHKYWHVLDSELGKDDAELGSPSHFVEPKQTINYFGEKCLKLNDKDLLNREALCYGGDFNKGEPAYFWGCDAEGSEPNSSCKNTFFYKTLEYSVTSSRKCAPFMNNKLRDFAINFVEQGRKRAQELGAKPKRPME
jgi:hypothetical protein